MPICVNCRATLHPMFFDVEGAKSPKLCIFCVRDTDKIRYGEKNEEFTKLEAIKEYSLFLKELSKVKTIEDTLDILKQQETELEKAISQGEIK